MSHLESKDICELLDVPDDTAFLEFSKSGQGLAMIPEVYGQAKQVLLKAEAGDFAKWIRTARPDVPISVQGGTPKLVLRSSDYWLPLIFLASDVTLPVFLHIVGSYLYEKMKGLLKGETARVHISVLFQDKKSGRVKRFNFEGDAAALDKVIRKFDLNQFLDD